MLILQRQTHAFDPFAGFPLMWLCHVIAFLGFGHFRTGPLETGMLCATPYRSRGLGPSVVYFTQYFQYFSLRFKNIFYLQIKLFFKINEKISRSVKNRQLMAVRKEKGKRAITNYKTLEVFENNKTPTLSLVECKLETGRTHQIRVHLTSCGNSIIGDKKYGKIMKSKKRGSYVYFKK